MERIEVSNPLVAGSENQTNRYQGEVKSQFGGVTLRWKPLPGVTQYQIKMMRKPGDLQAILQRSVAASEYSFNKGKLFTGEIYYAISAPLAGGWIATSKVAVFSFSFLPPALVLPEDGAVVAGAAMAQSDNSILLTWQRTNFTIGYELEVASDPQFATVVQRKLSKENFFILRALPVGRYWWRVRCYSKKISSPFSRPNLLSISP